VDGLEGECRVGVAPHSVGECPSSFPVKRSEDDEPQVVDAKGPPSSTKKMVMMVREFPVPVESLSHLSCLPSVEELRPPSCPLCRQPARGEEGLRIVGHGTYLRQLLGFSGGCREVVIWIRRFLCFGCRHTISVQPLDLYPGRWYAGVAILLSLVLSLLRGKSDGEIRERFCDPQEARGWKSLERWRRQLFSPLWSWLGRQLGASGPPGDREESLRRLWRLLSLGGAGPNSSPKELEAVVRRLVGATAHVGSLGWEIRRGLPVGFRHPGPRRAGV